LFSLAGNSSLEDASSRTGAKAFQKSFPVKYGALFLLIPASLLFLGAVFTALFLPAILIGIFLFFFWRMTLFAPYMISVEENRLFTQSFLKKQNLTAQQIKNIRLISLRNRHGVAKNFIQIEPLEGKAFRLSKFPEGNEMMYGFLKNWWGAYQAE